MFDMCVSSLLSLQTRVEDRTEVPNWGRARPLYTGQVAAPQLAQLARSGQPTLQDEAAPRLFQIVQGEFIPVYPCLLKMCQTYQGKNNSYILSCHVLKSTLVTAVLKQSREQAQPHAGHPAKQESQGGRATEATAGKGGGELRGDQQPPGPFDIQNLARQSNAGLGQALE